MNYLHRLQNLGKKGPSAWLQAVLARIPGQPIKTERFWRIQFDGYPDYSGLLRATANIRPAGPDDIDRLVGCVDKRALFGRRFALGDYCLAVFDKDRVVGYLWLSVRPEHIEERYWYRFDIPSDAIYIYDAFVMESFRGRGIWRQMIQATADIMKKENRCRLIGHIDHDNVAALAIYDKLGFRRTRAYCYTELFRKQILTEILGIN